MLKIGDFSKVAQVSVKTLRYYGDRGLLTPAWIDRFSGYRYYSLEQLPQLNRILALKDLGFSLEQIEGVLRENVSTAELSGMMRLRHAELEQVIHEEQARLARIEARLRQIVEEEALPAYEVVLKSAPTQRVVGVRDVIPDAGQVTALFDELQAYLAHKQISLDVTCPCIGVYYDREYHDRGLDVEIAAPISRSMVGTPRITAHELPGVETMACVVFQGSPERLPGAYNWLMSWVEMSGYQVVGPTRDLFLQRPLSPDDPAAHITEVQFPIEEKPYLSVVKKLKEQNKMEPKIKTKPAFTVVGVQYHGKNEHNEIAQMWQAFMPRMAEIGPKVKPDESYGVCGELEEGGAFKYVAGFEVDAGADVPDGMVKWNMPEQLYAVFPCTLHTIHETYQYVHQTWLPTSGYKRVDAPDFEFYDADFDPTEPDSTLYVCIPIK